MNSKGSFLLVFFAVFLVSSSPKAQKGPLYDTPVYNPESKSYFELVYLGTKGRRPWKKAYRLARNRVFKGVHGRLAVVKSAATNEFLRTTFRSHLNTWFGLRIWCINRKIQWVTGEYLTRSDYQNWHPHWNQANGYTGCGRDGRRGEEAYMPVNYDPGQGFKWIAKGGWKDYNAMFVEYPTGHE